MSWPDYLSGIFLGLLVGVSIGARLEYASFRRSVMQKASTGIRMEFEGRLFVIEEIERE